MKSEKFKDATGTTWIMKEFRKEDFKELVSYNSKFPDLYSKCSSSDKVLESTNCSNGEEALLITSSYILFFYYVHCGMFDEARELMEELIV